MANIVTGNFIPSFHAAQGMLKFDTAAITFTEAAALDTFFATTATAAQIIACKNITVTPPKGDVEIIQLLGVETTTVGAGVPAGGTFQNAVYDEKAWVDATMTCTLILVGDPTNLPNLLGLALGTTGIAISTTHYRWTFGSSDSAETRLTVGSILLSLENGAEECHLVMVNPYVNVGDIKPTGMEGHFEIDFEAKCLPKNFAIEMKK